MPLKTIKLSDKSDLTIDQYKAVWDNHGVYVDTDSGEAFQVEMTDALSHPNSTYMFPVTVETMIREAIEPVLVGSQLLERIQYTPGLQMSFGSIGAITAEDVNESGEYPEYTINFGPGAQIITIGKSGLAVKFTDEWKRYSMFDSVSTYIRAMGRALARHKEHKIFKMFGEMGVTTHDNVTPASSVFGRTQALDYDGTVNGGITADDLIEAYGQVLANGYTPDVLLVHPLTFSMFMTDPLLRAFALANGGGSWYNGYTGSAQTEYPWSKGLLGKAGPGLGAESSSSDPIDLKNSASMKMPDYFGLPLRVVVSPFVPYAHDTKVTDLFMIDTSNVGALVVDEEPVMEEIPDRLHEITKIKIRERYSLMPYNGGNAVAIMKNVTVVPSKVILPVQATMADVTVPDRKS